MLYGLGIDGGESIARPALKFYEMALEKSFTKGRRKEQVQAACLYIACRENKKPFLLIDFSEYLRINVYVLGAVFLQLCKILHLEDHPIVQKPVDPSLFIHRFTDRKYLWFAGVCSFIDSLIVSIYGLLVYFKLSSFFFLGHLVPGANFLVGFIYIFDFPFGFLITFLDFHGEN
ncbi:transcription factor IIIB 70 kDa subunit-like [Capsicum annuum]|uniref:transcription factor IIIB 70 kDa subunit-like n=1 Tax=Capsicum annuum TaxID=4072 RepID=UPI001FB166C1|nr:transcription factor IIIB 70 kDa subunit-like [Capsicum annuum]